MTRALLDPSCCGEPTSPNSDKRTAIRRTGITLVPDPGTGAGPVMVQPRQLITDEEADVGEPGRRETAQVTAVADHVRFDVHDGAATIQLNRAEKRNAVSRDMWITITGHLSAAAENPEIRALVVTGLPGVFCAGADLTSV